MSVKITKIKGTSNFEAHRKVICYWLYELEYIKSSALLSRQVVCDTNVLISLEITTLKHDTNVCLDLIERQLLFIYGKIILTFIRVEKVFLDQALDRIGNCYLLYVCAHTNLLDGSIMTTNWTKLLLDLSYQILIFKNDFFLLSWLCSIMKHITKSFQFLENKREINIFISLVI